MPTPRRAAAVNAMDRFSPEPVKRGSGDREKGGCRCGRTKCLKQYCACFRNDERCTSDCVCTDCCNDGRHEDERMMAVRAIRLNSKEAFKGTDLMIDDQTVTTPKGSVKTVRGCRCKRSRCLKKYCECYGVGLKCGDNCICEGCQNGNDGGGPSAVKKGKGTRKTKAKTSQSKVVYQPPLVQRSMPGCPAQGTAPSAQLKVVSTNVTSTIPIINKTQFKPQPSGRMLASRKPPLSVNIPAPASQPIPVQRDLPMFDRNGLSLTNTLSARSWGMLPAMPQVVSTAWGMTPLGSASGGMDLENSGQGFPLYSANTPTGGFNIQREISGLPMWHPPVWGETDVPSARSITLCSPAALGMGFVDSPKLSGMSLTTPRSPLRSAMSMTQAQAMTQASPGAIFTAAEGMLPSPVRGQSGLSTLGMNEDLVHSMGREISARF